MVTRALSQVKAMVWKDLMVEVRRPVGLGASLVFALSASVLVGFAASRHAVNGELIAVTGLVLTQAFIAVFTATMSFVQEHDRGTLNGIRLSPVEPVVAFVSKLLFTLVLLEVLTVVTVSLASLFSGFVLGPLQRMYYLLLTAGIYFSSVSAFASVLSVYVEARGVLLPTIVLALSLPMIQSVVALAEGPGGSKSVASLALSGLGFATVVSWLSKYALEV